MEVRVLEDDIRLDKYLALNTEYSREYISKMLDEGFILVNGKKLKPSYKVKVNDVITIDETYKEETDIVPTKMDIDIIYEDQALLVINKPAGIPVHPSMDHFEDSLSNGVRYYFDQIGLKKKIRPVNRIDKDTSGIVIFAKNEYIQECLVKQMKTKEFEKE